ncbi:AlbA family DNA-binding domain-containing protein [Ancylomarina sp. YFZ004]
MEFSKIIFNKDIYELTIDDILDFFGTEQEESSILEFKAGKVEMEDIFREVSAFLNTGGGLLIVGAPFEKKIRRGKNEVKVCIGDPIPSIRIKNLDNLVRSISSNISPAPIKIRAKEVEYKEGNIYILEIPQSFTPPHQVSNEGKYYIRLERDSKPAPHGVVEALFFKRQKPNLQFKINISPSKNNVLDIRVILSNDSYVTAENINFVLNIDGVKEVLESSKNQCNLKDNVLNIQSNNHDTILVKGIETNIKLKLEMINKYCRIDCLYFCKDSIALRKKYILNVDGEIECLKILGPEDADDQKLTEQFCNYYAELKNEELSLSE